MFVPSLIRLFLVDLQDENISEVTLFPLFLWLPILQVASFPTKINKTTSIDLSKRLSDN